MDLLTKDGNLKQMQNGKNYIDIIRCNGTGSLEKRNRNCLMPTKVF